MAEALGQWCLLENVQNTLPSGPQSLSGQDLNGSFLTSPTDLEMSGKSQGSEFMLPETVTFQGQN